MQLPVATGALESQRYGVRPVLTALFRRRWIVLGVFSPIFLVGVWGTLTTISTFTATTRVLVQARTVETPEFQHLPVDNDVLISTAVQVAQSIPVAERAAESMADTIGYFRAEYPDKFAKVATPGDLLDLVYSKLGAGQVGESNVIEISYSHPNQEFALAVVSSVTRAFLEYSVESRQNKSALEYYSEQITELEGEIAEMLDRRLQVYDEGGLSAYKENNQSGIQHMRAVEYDFHKAQARRAGLEKRLQAITEAVAADPHFVPTVTSAGENANLIGARQQYDDAVMELARARITYNDSSEFVRRQELYVAQAELIFVGIRDAYVNDLSVDLEIARSEEASIAASLQQYRQELLAYPALEKQLYSIDLEIESKKDLLEALQTKRGAIRLKAFGDERISNVTQLDESSIEPGVQGGKKVAYLFFSSFLGLVLSVVVGLVVDSMDHRIYNVHQAELHLGVPVLGAVSAVTRPGQER